MIHHEDEQQPTVQTADFGLAYAAETSEGATSHPSQQDQGPRDGDDDRAETARLVGKERKHRDLPACFSALKGRLPHSVADAEKHRQCACFGPYP